MLITHLHLQLRLTKTGSIILLLLYFVMVWTGTTSPLTLPRYFAKDGTLISLVSLLLVITLLIFHSWSTLIAFRPRDRKFKWKLPVQFIKISKQIRTDYKKSPLPLYEQFLELYHNSFVVTCCCKEHRAPVTITSTQQTWKFHRFSRNFVWISCYCKPPRTFVLVHYLTSTLPIWRQCEPYRGPEPWRYNRAFKIILM